MRRVWLCGLSLLLTSAAQGQSDSARIAALEAKVALLDSIISSKGFLAPRWPCEEKEARRPSTYFPNGEYNLEYRNRQFGCFAGKVVDDVAGLQAQVSGLATRLAAVESRSGLGRTIRADTLILGTCKTTSNQMLQL